MLREMKKQQTRQAISDVATRLFIERGFDEVTIAQVAAAAKVAKMTVTNHFPRKEDLVFDVHEEFVSGLAVVVTGDEPVLAAVRDAYFASLERRDPLLGFSGRAFARMILSSPTLLSRLRELHEERERVLVGALTPRLDQLTAQAVATQITAAYRVLFHEVLRRTSNGERDRAVAEAVGRSAARMFDLLESGLGETG
jgi:AcrR family transcriptional regulator